MPRSGDSSPRLLENSSHCPDFINSPSPFCESTPSRVESVNSRLESRRKNRFLYHLSGTDFWQTTTCVDGICRKENVPNSTPFGTKMG
ncbi:hypothetical protein CEXT_230211 [Caerostris extrusa]|uniref:Uncharacterized protein n=1 Tax=Caerostris extrusa TaxID=172846 RepID=A0AAV4NQS2_CAEEX|nr:hypothetical protein CEXT_230211 [Caerostris extrusa]